jgi:phosphatidylglycerophosphatase A
MSGIDWRECRDLRVFLATGLGSGFSPRAPGTAGSLVAFALWWFLLAPLPLALGLGVLLVVIALGLWTVVAACRKLRVGDDPRIVLDEWLGTWVALIGCPREIVPAVAALVLFRAFDIAKPWPVSWADREVEGGVGVVLDDLIAGGLAAGVLHLSIAILHTFSA